MDDPPQIHAITIDHPPHGTRTWSRGDSVEINNPGHPDHGERGLLVTFQILALKREDWDDQGLVHPVVDLGRREPPTLHVVPFDKLLPILEDPCSTP